MQSANAESMSAADVTQAGLQVFRGPDGGDTDHFLTAPWKGKKKKYYITDVFSWCGG